MLNTPQPKWLPHRGIVWHVMRNRRLRENDSKNIKRVISCAVEAYSSFVGYRASQRIRMLWKRDFRQNG